jgi:hypothetical protein
MLSILTRRNLISKYQKNVAVTVSPMKRKVCIYEKLHEGQNYEVVSFDCKQSFPHHHIFILLLAHSLDHWLPLK